MTSVPSGTLAGQVALVTGCGRRRGIGAGVAGALLGQGCAVAVTDVLTGRDPAGEGLDRVIEQLRAEVPGGVVEAFGADLTDPAQITALVASVSERFGPIDILVNNAAATHGTDRGDPVGVTLSDLDAQLAVNVRAAFLLMQAVVPGMRAKHHGRIVNMSSQAAHIGIAGRAVYTMTKAALLGLTRALSADLGPDGITVNSICPGIIATDRLTDTMAKEGPGGGNDAAIADDAMGAWAQAVPVGRVGMPADIGNAVAFLASERASYISGHALTVDGGRFAI
jgi:NAD(P)-dependent dehydrogenase (short-subunit alcohol dehydrogenase family)